MLEVIRSADNFPTFFGFKSNQITMTYSVFHPDSEYNILKKFKKINVIEILESRVIFGYL